MLRYYLTFLANGTVAERSQPPSLALASQGFGLARAVDAAGQEDALVAKRALPAFLATKN